MESCISYGIGNIQQISFNHKIHFINPLTPSNTASQDFLLDILNFIAYSWGRGGAYLIDFPSNLSK